MTYALQAVHNALGIAKKIAEDPNSDYECRILASALLCINDEIIRMDRIASTKCASMHQLLYELLTEMREL
jgi:myosin-crossreactive antigen